MNAQTQVPWPVVLNQLWPDCRWLKTEAEAVAAADTMRARFGQRMPDRAELVEVLRWMAADREWDQKKAPSLRQLIMAVYVHRKRGDRDRDEDQQAESCGHCHGGWVEEVGTGGWPLLMLPCTCPAGIRQMDKVKDYRGMNTEHATAFYHRREKARSEASLRCSV